MVWQNQILAGASGNQSIEYPDDPTTGYTAWYRADTVTTSGSDVTQWDDKSSSNLDLTRISTSHSPQLVASDSNFNGQPSIDFTDQNGASSRYAFGTAGSANTGTGRATMFSSGMDEFSIFAVYRGSSSQSSYSYSEIIGDYSGYIWLGPHSSTTMSIGNGTLTQSGWSRDNTFASHAWNGATSGSANLSLKTTGLTTAVHGSNPTFSTASNSMLVGSGSTNSFYFQGHIAEILVYPTALTGDDASTTELYLAGRYGLSW